MIALTTFATQSACFASGQACRCRTWPSLASEIAAQRVQLSRSCGVLCSRRGVVSTRVLFFGGITATRALACDDPPSAVEV